MGEEAWTTAYVTYMKTRALVGRWAVHCPHILGTLQRNTASLEDKEIGIC